MPPPGARSLLLAATVLVVAGCGAEGSPVASPASTPASTAGYDATLPGRIGALSGLVAVGTTLTTDRTLRIASGRLTLDGRAEQVMFVPHDGRDTDGPEDYGPLTVAAGVELDVSSGGSPDCADDRHDPVVLELALSDGGTLRYLVGDAEAYAAAARRVCQRGVVGDVRGSSQQVDGSFSVTLALVNPGPAAATVTSAAYDAGTTHFDEASVVVPARASQQLVVRGQGVDQLAGCTHDTPWAAGLLTANGAPVTLPRSADPC